MNPVSEELLNRAIRSNVELAQTLSQLVREVHEGLGVIQVQSSRLAASTDDAHRASLVAAIEHQVKRMQQMLRETGQPAGSRAPGPPHAPPTPPRGISAPAPPPRPGPTPAPPLPFPSPARPAATSEPPVAHPAAHAPGPAAAAAAATNALDGLVAEMVQLSRPALAARPVSVEVRMAPGTPLPRCSPIGLKRSFAALFQGLSAVVAPQSAIVVRAEKKPVLFKGRDGSQQTRDFLMIAATHAGGLADADQQRVLQGADAGPLGEAQRLVREMGGFIRFAPLPGGALETRIFLPA